MQNRTYPGQGRQDRQLLLDAPLAAWVIRAGRDLTREAPSRCYAPTSREPSGPGPPVRQKVRTTGARRSHSAHGDPGQPVSRWASSAAGPSVSAVDAGRDV